MKTKLIIAQRTNWEDRFYIKFKVSEKAMKIIKKIVEELGSNYFVDNHVLPKNFSKYDKWKDQWIPLFDVNPNIDIICGDKFIHMIIFAKPDNKKINLILDKYCKWEEPNKK